MAECMAYGAYLPHGDGSDEAEILRARDVPLSVGKTPYGACP